jgi:hypothetical protein
VPEPIVVTAVDLLALTRARSLCATVQPSSICRINSITASRTSSRMGFGML